MKKILIISYFFPPCNLTASQRVFSWAKYFHQFGYYPIIITRRWDNEILKMDDINKPTPAEKIIEKYDTYEVHYMPYTGNLRDKLMQLQPNLFFKIARKFLSFAEQITQFFWLKTNPYNNIYFEAEKIIAAENIEQLIISANPYPSFYFGYLLKKKFKNLKWYADYRDDWNTKLLAKDSLQRKLFNWYESIFEKKWLHTAHSFFAVSDFITEKISGFIHLKGYTIGNGFYEEDYFNLPEVENKNEFIITYTGQLYGEQDFSIFISAFKKAVDEFKNQIQLKLNFVGIGLFETDKKYLQQLLSGYESCFEILPRTSKAECIKIEDGSDALLMVAYGNLKGIPASKLYQYLGHKKPIIVCPTDDDIIQKTVTDCGVGWVAKNETDAFDVLKNLIHQKINGTLKSNTVQKINTFEIEKLSRRLQAKKLIEVLNQN